MFTALRLQSQNRAKNESQDCTRSYADGLKALHEDMLTHSNLDDVQKLVPVLSDLGTSLSVFSFPFVTEYIPVSPQSTPEQSATTAETANRKRHFRTQRQRLHLQGVYQFNTHPQKDEQKKHFKSQTDHARDGRPCFESTPQASARVSNSTNQIISKLVSMHIRQVQADRVAIAN